LLAHNRVILFVEHIGRVDEKTNEKKDHGKKPKDKKKMEIKIKILYFAILRHISLDARFNYLIKNFDL